MIQIINNDLTGKLYITLLNLLYEYCDAVTFNVQNVFQEHITDENLKYFDEFELKEIGYTPNNYVNTYDCKEYMEYKKSLEPFLSQFNNFVIRRYEDVEYCGYMYRNKMDIFVIELNDNVVKLLKKSTGLYKWCYPDRPNDLCFYKDNKCFLRSVAHEGLCFIYSNDRRLKKKLVNLGFNIIRVSNEPIPILQY